MGQILQSTDAGPVARPRLDAVDWLRGLVMVVMALDHVRDFFGDMSFNAIDPHQTTIHHYFTRWVTHFCAPTFIFLTGAGIFLTGARGRTKRQLAWFVFTRGLWLLVLELTYIRFFWIQFDLTYKEIPLGVFWSIGASMVVLAPLLLLPDWIVITLGLAIVLGHNAVDRMTLTDIATNVATRFGVSPMDVSSWEWLWKLIHGDGNFKLIFSQGQVHVAEAVNDGRGVNIYTAYKLTWVGVMMAGYGFGRILLFQPARRRLWLFGLGLGLTAAFLVVRGNNGYGDPNPRFSAPDPTELAKIEQWRSKSNPPPTVCSPLPPAAFTALSFCNCEKYPPSLSYLLMTLGPAILMLAVAFERPPGPLGRVLITFGRVPLFYYLLHIALIVPAAAVWYFAGHALGVYGSIDEVRRAGGLHVPLWGVYLLWLTVVTILYFPCRWYADLKRRSRNPLLSYL